MLKKTLSTLGLAVALSLSAAAVSGAQSTQAPNHPQHAQQDSTFRRGRGGPGRMLLKDITLSANQQNQMKTLRAEQRKQIEAQRGKTDAKAERGKWREQNLAAVRNILTADQRVQFDKNVAEMRAHRPRKSA